MLPLSAQVPLGAPASESSSEAAPEEEAIPHAPVMVNGRKVFDLSGATSGEAKRRAAIVNRRLELLVSREEKVEPFQPSDVVIREGYPLITLGDEPILTITNADVEDTLIPTQELAQIWGKQLSDNVAAARIARSGPFRNAAIVLLTSTYDLFNSVASWLPRLLGVLLLALCFWPLAKLARWLAKKATNSPRVDPNITQLAIAVAFYGMWALGLLAMLSAMGIDSTGIAAAVGASGFILGFAFQDVLSHFFAGMLLLMGRQFYIGGQIKVGEHEGIVERIDLRALYLRTFDNLHVTIPNGQVFNSSVVVNTSNLWRRREFTIGIGYEADARRAMELALAAIRSVDGVLDEPEPRVLVSELGASSVNLRMFFYTNTGRPNIEWLTSLSECILRVKEAFDGEGINIPFSTHTIDIRHIGELGNVLKPVLENVTDEVDNNTHQDELTLQKS